MAVCADTSMRPRSRLFLVQPSVLSFFQSPIFFLLRFSFAFPFAFSLPFPFPFSFSFYFFFPFLFLFLFPFFFQFFLLDKHKK